MEEFYPRAQLSTILAMVQHHCMVLVWSTIVSMLWYHCIVELVPRRASDITKSCHRQHRSICPRHKLAQSYHEVFLLAESVDGTFENTQWRKVK